MKGKIYLMGIGPGDPDLLTLQAVRLLRSAEVVLHDDHVSPEILQLIPASAQVRAVSKLSVLAGNLREKIQALLISAAREGHLVVRLKAGDLVQPEYGYDETQPLARAGVDYEVISGAASASAVRAATGANSR